ncbi:hypothetical protein EZV62_014378 [Acer yangbiense]|uniref:Rhodanese domain-containing protein n=1 Tax=Acer yangbiense TaxID=1000413 RepID=A0A5C7HSH3_9ROSI|nr:hypothetical protein EZV62_014378 [Acer yangbiense]
MGVSRVVFLLLLLLLVNSSCEGAEVVTIDVHQTKDLLHSGSYSYLDVRTVEEYKKGRVKNPDFLKEVTSLCKEDDHLVVGCQSGVRSVYATSDLLTAGFKDVSNMGGGYLSWVENGFPVKVDEKLPQEKSESAAEL